MLDRTKRGRGVPRRTLIAHRGASGYRPENTLAAFELAVAQGADSLELDVVPTKDGKLVVRHESELSKTTDVATRGEFASRRSTKVIDDTTRSGWFTEDFTLAELRVLRTKERMRLTRPQSRKFNGIFPVPTLDEVVALASGLRTSSGQQVGLYIETKHSTYFRSIGLPLEEQLVAVLYNNGYGSHRDAVWIESFETTNLRDLAERTDLNLVQLIRGAGRPHDLRVRGDRRSYADLTSRRGLREISGYAQAVALSKQVAIPTDEHGRLLEPTAVIREAHRVNLTVLGWTFRRENRFLPKQFRVGDDPFAPGDLAGEINAFVSAGMDGFFLDNPDVSSPATFTEAAPRAVPQSS